MRNLRTILVAAVASLLSMALLAQAQSPGVNSTLQNVYNLVYEASTVKPSYSATVAGAAPAASATDVCTLTGSATRTIRVRRIIYTGNVTTAVAEPISIVKRSTASTGGAGSVLAKASYDSANPASTVALAEVWTTSPTVGTYVGTIADIVTPLAASPAITPAVTFMYGTLAQPLVLRGVAQSLSVNLSGVTHSGTFGCTFEWTEESP